MRPALLLAFALAACQSTGDLAYRPTLPVTPGPPVIAAVTTQDIRGDWPTRLAVLRGVYGKPAETFDTARPVADEVSAAFTEALRARGMLAPAAPDRITVMLRRYAGEAGLVRRAAIDLQLYVLDAAGHPIYQDAYSNETGGLGSLGTLPGTVRSDEQLLAAAIDALLDKPALRILLATPNPPPLPGV